MEMFWQKMHKYSEQLQKQIHLFLICSDLVQTRIDQLSVEEIMSIIRRISFLAGKFAARECSAAAQKGLVTLLKHCALNEQETARQGANGSGSNTTYCSWANEQTRCV